jgi:hypothetical protein
VRLVVRGAPDWERNICTQERRTYVHAQHWDLRARPGYLWLLQ